VWWSLLLQRDDGQQPLEALDHTGDAQQFFGGVGLVSAGGDDDAGNAMFVEYVSITAAKPL